MKKLILLLCLASVLWLTASAEEATVLNLEVVDWHPGVPGYDVTYTIMADNGDHILNWKSLTFTCDTEGATIEKNKITINEECRNRGEDVIVTVIDNKTGAEAVIAIPVKIWTLTFADEFDGTSMDQTKWSNFETGLGNEIQVKGGLANCTVADGCMTMNLIYDADQGRWVYPSISTYGKFQQRFGCFQAKIKIPPYSGINTAFWMLSPGSYNGSPLYYQRAVPEWACYEIDFLEISAAWTKNHDQYKKHMQSGIYWKNAEMDVARAQGITPSPDIVPYEEYVDYACVWLEDGLYFYCNGELQGVEKDVSPDHGKFKAVGGYMILTVATADSQYMIEWMGPWDFTQADAPITASVDWVRAWE